jgi:hypothetical protein
MFICTYDSQFSKDETLEKAFFKLRNDVDDTLTAEDCFFYKISEFYAGRTSLIFDQVKSYDTVGA